MHDVAFSGGCTAPPAISAALRQAFRDWDSLFEQLPIGVYTCDCAGRIVQYNRRAAALWGQAPDPAARETFYFGADRAFHPDGRPLAPSEAPMAELLETGRPLRDRKVILERPDGSRITILANLEPLYGEHGEHGAIVGGISCFQDISALQRAEEALRERDQRLAATYEHADIGIAEIDAQGGSCG